jgi:hypothetical protein
MLREDGVKILWTAVLRGGLITFAALAVSTSQGRAQNASPTTTPSARDAVVPIRELQDQVQALRAMVQEMRAENAQSRAEMQQLRQDLQATRALLERPAGANSPAMTAQSASSATEAVISNTAVTQAPQSNSIDDRVQKLEDTTSLIGSKIDEQYQTKVETASKYRGRLHGIVLMNAFRNLGNSDNLDSPTYAEPVLPGWPQANVGATLRQSQIGLELFGPTVAGAKTSADIQFDFSGGFPATGNGVNFGIVRLQTGSLHLDWKNTSIIAGQDSLFISPLSPTSFASLSIPAFASVGNLWAWTPQIRVEHRFPVSDQQTITLQAGLLDNLDWETPYNSFYRSATAGELSGQPAFAFRGAWSRPIQQHPLSVGVAGYYGKQNWYWGRTADSWAGMLDWQVPLMPRLALSGEFYRGRAIGGLGGGVATSILYGGAPRDRSTPIRGLDDIGGWAQLKLQVTPKVELNGAVSDDNAYAGDVRGFALDTDNFGPILGRNRGILGNVVFRPRSDLLLSAELKRLRTFPVYSSSSMTNQLNLAVGILF